MKGTAYIEIAHPEVLAILESRLAITKKLLADYQMERDSDKQVGILVRAHLAAADTYHMAFSLTDVLHKMLPEESR